MDKEKVKVLLPIIRKIYPSMIARQITGIQPMTGNVGEILSMVNKSKWTDWRKTTSLWPRKSITGKFIFGRINKRSKTSFRGTRALGGRSIPIKEYATNKELFTAKLKGET